METLNSISLKCANCGANLQITPEMETFACGYCGASQIVSRSGGTISLKLLGEAITRVQAGTDKTAAELAIRRLKEEYVALENEYKRLDEARWSKESEIRSLYTWIAIALTFCCLFFLGAVGWATALTVIVWLGGSGAIIYFYFMQSEANRKLYENAKLGVSAQMKQVLDHINKNKKIVGY
jgi:DNA-directed RNA polymerase subunit RPC12/RpoP/Flp pilus assembly protein TadB